MVLFMQNLYHEENKKCKFIITQGNTNLNGFDFILRPNIKFINS